MVGPCGLEPQTSTVSIQMATRAGMTTSKCERHGTPMFTGVRHASRPIRSSLSDTDRFAATWVGMARLRHKVRHKNGRSPELSGPRTG
jgi:hypothetical protein